MDISKIITSQEVNAYWREQPAPMYFGESKFPNKKQRGMKLEFVKGAARKPVMLSLSAFDANSISLTRGSFEVLNENMPFFKNDFVIDEHLIRELEDIDANRSTAVKSVVAKIFDDTAHLREDAALTREVLRMQMLTTGVISLSDNGQTFAFDYKLPSSHKVQPTIKWDTVATADPLSDLETWQQAIVNETGIRPTEILMNSKTLAAMGSVDSVKSAVFDSALTPRRPSNIELKQWIKDKYGITVFVDDDVYSKNGVLTKLVPDGTIVGMPSGDLGVSWFGVTPEEARLEQTTVIDTGVAITTWHKDDPVASYIKASQIFLPSFEHADEIFIASVL